jgi:flagellar hook-associated protein 1 FlgK
MSILNTAYSGLSAFQNALSVIGNNITNSTTQGYSRQTIQFIPSLSQKIGTNYVGTGVAVSNIFRNSDDFANYQVRNTSSMKSQYDVFFQQASQVDQLLSPNGAGLSTPMQTFFSAVSAMNSNPADLSARTSALKQTQLLANQFKTLQGTLNQYQQNASSQIQQSVGQVNTITKNIAQINQKLIGSPNSPELMDQRDTLLKQLSQYMDITMVNLPNGTINVGFGNGQPLVSGISQNNLSVSSDKTNNFTTKITLGGQNITSLFNSGSLKGILDYENNILGKASQSLGQMAIGLAQAFNSQQALGIDGNNNLGSNVFTDYNSNSLQKTRAFALSSNTGTAILKIRIEDISQTQVSDYELTVADATNHKYNLVRKSDGTSIPLTWDSSSASSPATLSVDGTGATTVEGISITVDDIANLVDNDDFIIAPTRGAATQLNVALTDPKGFALAASVSTSAATGNTGQGTIELGTVYNPSAVNNNYTITIDSIDPTKYTISGDPTVYDIIPGSNNTIYLPPGSTSTDASYSVVLSGVPNSGDEFSLGFNSGAVGDNRNGLLLASLQQSKLFSAGEQSILDRYSDLVSTVGADTNDAKLRSSSADVVYNQAINYQSNISGVNIEEEATNLLKYQQAYQAAGKVMQVANDMMNIIFSMME